MLQVLRVIVAIIFCFMMSGRHATADLITSHKGVPVSNKTQEMQVKNGNTVSKPQTQSVVQPSVNLETSPVYRKLSGEFKEFANRWRRNHPLPNNGKAILSKCPENSNKKVYVYMTKYMFNDPLTVKQVIDKIKPEKRGLTLIFVIVTKNETVSPKNYPFLNRASLEVAGSSGVEIEKNPEIFRKVESVDEPYFVLDSIYSLNAEGKVDDFDKIYNAVTPIYY